MKIKLFIILLMLIAFNGYAQLDSLEIQKIRDKVWVEDKKSKKVKTITTYQLDTLLVDSEVYSNKIQSSVKLPVSKGTLRIDSYFDEEGLYFVSVKEESSKTKDFDEIYKMTEIYFLENKIVDVRVLYGIPICMGVPLDLEEYFDFNPNLDKSVLEDLILKINNY